MKVRPYHGWLVACGLATIASHPHPVGPWVLDLGLVAGWGVPAFLLLALEGQPPRRAGLMAFAVSGVAHLGVFHWFFVVTVVYGHASPLLGLLAPLAPALYVSLWAGLFGVAWGWLGARGLGSPLAAAVLWTTLDWIRSWFITGFPWATLGYSQHLDGPLLGLSSWTGVYGLSFVVVLGGAALARAWLEVRRGAVPGRTTQLALLTVVVAHGVGWLIAPDDPSGPKVRIAAIQGNIDQGVKWSWEWMERTLAIYETATREAADAGARIVVWPETAVPGAIERDPELQSWLERLAESSGVTLVVGGVGIEPGADERGFLYYDSAFVFEPAGGLSERYDKTHLVPFGEYVPLRGLIGKLAGALATGITSGDVTAGPEPRAVVIAAGADGEAGIRAGIPICYELIFPDLVRRFGRDGAGVLLALTNDAWYGRTGAPYQFLAMTALRSAETGLWTVRAANTGVSAVIDSRGRVVDETTLFEGGSVMADVPVSISPTRGRTFYARHGDVFALACVLGSIGLALIARMRSPEGER